MKRWNFGNLPSKFLKHLILKRPCGIEMTNSTEIQVLEGRVTKLESENADLREYIDSQVDWIRPAIFILFGTILFSTFGLVYIFMN